MANSLFSSAFSAISIKGYGIIFNVFKIDNEPIFTINTLTEKAMMIGDMTIRRNLDVGGVLSFSSIAPGLSIPAKVGNSRVLEVSDISEHTTLESALNAASNLVPPPSNINGVVIRIYPGLYLENNPLVVPEGVVIIGKAGRAPFVKILPIFNDVVFSIDGDCSLKNFMIVGNEIGTIGISAVNPGTTITVDKVVTTGCDTGIIFGGVGTSVNVLTCAILSSPGQTTTTGILVQDGVSANINIAYTTLISNPNPFTNGLIVDGTDAEVFLSTSRFTGNIVGLLARNGSNVDAQNSEFRNCTTGIRAETNASIIVNGGIFSGNTQDIVTGDTTVSVKLSSCSLSNEKIQYESGTDVQLSYFNTDNTNTGFTVEGGMNVGSTVQPTTSAFGEGRASVSDMSVILYEASSGMYQDVTTDASDPIANPFTVFPDITQNSAIYVGKSTKFWGFFNEIVGTISLGAGSIMFEYYNGTWTQFDVMVTQSGGSFYSYAQNPFTQAEEQNIRFGRIQNDWIKTSIFSVNKYWIRIRIVNDIAVSPILQYTKIHGSSTKINSEGFIEYFGKARPIRQIPYDINICQAAIYSPGNQDIYLSEGLNFGNIENQFANALGRIGMKFYLPPEIDTSFGVTLVWTWFAASLGGNVEWVIRWGYATELDVVYASSVGAPATWPNEQSIVLIESTPPVDKGLKTSTISLKIPDMVARNTAGLPQDILVITLDRNGAADTNNGNINLLQVAPFYYSWCNGLFGY